MPPLPGRPRSLAAKLGTVGAALLLLAMLAIGFMLATTWRLEGGAAAVNDAGRLRMQTWRLAQAAAEPARARRLAAEFDQSLAALGAGDPARPLALPRDAATRAAFDAVRGHWAALRDDWLAGRDTGTAEAASRAEVLVVHTDAFVAAIEARLAGWTALLSAFQLGLMGLAVAGGVALLYAATLFVFTPLARLRAGLARVEQGDLNARVEVDSGDEFGEVAAGFNRMAVTLHGFWRDLENRVREKTETLRAERERLAVLYEASGFVGRAASLEELAKGFAARLRAAGRADAALLRWNDDAHGRMLLLAADCVPAEMIEHERCLAPGACACGHADPGVRIVPIRAEGRAPSACERFGFTRVLTVPVRLHEQTLGEADLLYRGEAVALDAGDRALVDTLAAHLASGMESLRAAALEREAAVADERARLARELHDSIAQGLAFLKIQVQLLRGALRRGDGDAVRRTVDEIDTGVREGGADVRELLLHFRTRTDGDDIVPALQTTLQKFQHQTGLAAHLNVHDTGVPLPPDVQVQLLHVVQEALSNVRKHANASGVWLDVHQQPAWRIEVRDDGRGFDADGDATDTTHVGLRIMRERAAGIGAQVSVRSGPGRGTAVVVTLPERLAVAA